MAESFVAQEFIAAGIPLLSWHERTAQLEFLLEDGASITPVEVKAGNSVKAKSLVAFKQKYQPKRALKFSAKHFEKIRWNEETVNLPIYAWHGSSHGKQRSNSSWRL